jgi:hypothetical protein
VAQYPSVAIRMLRMQPWNPNPLMRFPDRLLAVLRILAVLICLAVIPLAGAVGTDTYTSTAEQIRSDNAAKVLVTATVTAEPSYGGDGRHRDATVQWNHDGRTATATAPVPRTASRGDQVTIWLGPDGTPAAPPAPYGRATARGIIAAAYVLVGTWLGAVLIVQAADWWLLRRHGARWEEQWRLFDREDR